MSNTATATLTVGSIELERIDDGPDRFELESWLGRNPHNGDALVITCETERSARCAGYAGKCWYAFVWSGWEDCAGIPRGYDSMRFRSREAARRGLVGLCWSRYRNDWYRAEFRPVAR